MKRIIKLAMLMVCLTAICNISKAQKQAANKQQPASSTETPVKVSMLKAVVAVKPIVPGGEFKATPEALALPAKQSITAPKDRTEIPNPALNMPVNTMPAVADTKQVAVKQTPAVQTPAVQHN